MVFVINPQLICLCRHGKSTYNSVKSGSKNSWIWAKPAFRHARFLPVIRPPAPISGFILSSFQHWPKSNLCFHLSPTLPPCPLSRMCCIYYPQTHFILFFFSFFLTFPAYLLPFTLSFLSSSMLCALRRPPDHLTNCIFMPWPWI